MSDWQPIGTAPKDGTRVIVGVWVHDEFDDETYWSDWIESFSDCAPHWGEDGTNGDEPTHWTPLPAPPRDSDAMLGTKPEGLSPEGVAARAAESGIARPTPDLGPDNGEG